MKIRIFGTSRKDSVFKQPLLRKILFISFAVAIALPLSYAFFLHPAFTKILIEDEIAEGIAMARHLSGFIPSGEAKLKKDFLRMDALTMGVRDKNDFGLTALKIFSKSGEIIFSTDDKDTGNINNEKYFDEILAKGKAHAVVVRKHTESFDGHQVPMDLLKAYVPLMSDGKFVGAFEVSSDIKSNQEELADLLLNTLIILSGFAAGLLFIILVVLIGENEAIREQKQASNALKEERDKAKRYLDIAGVIIVIINSDQKVRLISRKGVGLLGYKEDEIIGKNWFENFIPEGDRERMKSVFAKLMAGRIEPLEYFENPILTRRGEERLVAWHNSVLTDEAGEIIGTLSSGEDITERKRSEEALQRAQSHLERKVQERTAELVLSNEKLQREIVDRRKAEEQIRKSKAMLQSVFDGISDPLILLDKNMSIFMLNEAALKYYQLASDEDVIDMACYKAIKGQSSPCDGCNVSEHITGGSQVTFERKGCFDPDRLEQVVVYPIREAPGGVECCILRISDITENRNMENQLIRADRLSSLGQLSGGIAHEIRNPLSGIRLFVDILCDEEKFERTEAELEIFQEIRGNIHKINSIIGRILDFARGPQSTSTKIEVNSLINESLKLWYPRMRDREIKLELSPGDGLPDVLGDAIGIQQVVNNLIQNAIEAMSNGGRLSISTQNGPPSFNEGRPVVKIKIQDTGPGIAPDQQKKIFNPFFTTKPAGTGLGLAISYQIVERHGGVLTFYNNSDQGTTFTVELPATKRG
jgi:PAS domain S-box-containing protein